MTLQGFTALLFMFSVMLYLISSLFLRSYNNMLSTKKQNIEIEIAAIEKENDAVKIEIQTLANHDRINQMAVLNGLDLDQDNVITIENVAYDGE